MSSRSDIVAICRKLWRPDGLSKDEVEHFLQMIGLPKEQISMILQKGNWTNDEQIQCDEFLGFVFGEATIPKVPLAPGLYKYLPYTSRFTYGDYEKRFLCELELINKFRFRDKDRYAIVKPSGHMYLVSCRLGEEFFKSIGIAIEDLWPDLSLYQQQSEIVTMSWISGSKIVKILPEEEFERLTQPRPFSICLAGKYELGEREYVVRGRSITIYRPESIEVSPSGSVSWTSAYEQYRKQGSESYKTSPETTSLQVKSVSRSLNNWTVKLHPGEEPRIEVVYPPLCVLQLSNGESVDLSQWWGFSGESALLSSTKISYHGKIKETEGSECIVSFPGRYADGWRECVEASAHDMGVACVFLCGKDDGFGEHAIDPDAGGSICYCHKIYGRRDFKLFGHKTEEECIANGNRPTWGCRWFQKWRDNIEVAVKRKQRLIAYFFVGQVGQGLVAWDDLATADLWAGKGLGGSQKGELAFLQKMGYEFEMRDVQEFLDGFSQQSCFLAL